ncbi:RelA/SpoT family protein [Spirochaeta cellobiosiphila]|uniref:RelA/SpoT family protein n=1 Tax=Spirochaeta cellobiosiphila TaxID=504483 RepID=UPI000414A5FB|nr:bifunctional (p)ppGpp synthetase/guanosine-3',5'-bis(diphosphate) 3'-pyrophosphohydrolase [Spirochaeta cellobiosiphila]
MIEAKLVSRDQISDLFEDFRKTLDRFPPEEQDKIMEAAHFADSLHKEQKRASGEPYIIHPLKVATILNQDLKMDPNTIMAGLLHDIIEDTEITNQQLKDKFGEEVERLVDGVTKISILHAKSKSVQEAETIRKMFFAMIKDIRVILIKLSDKVHNMSTLQHLPPHKIKRIATECLDIYAPLAGRLGISNIKSELEDLALKNLYKEAYYEIKAVVDAKRGERAKYLQRVKDKLLSAAHAERLDVEVETRAKHFYSIYKKMKKKGRSASRIYDLLGIRVYCNTPSECYTMLGIVHKNMTPIEGRFKDYIAMPKANGYQSLHTTVMGDQGKLMEIQIRTHEMHRTAEYGIAAHWIYKKGTTIDKVNTDEIAFVQKLKSWDNMKFESQEFLSEIKGELLKDDIYVFTPKGKVIQLAKGSTAIDFAYHIHTDIGDHIIGAKADGQIIPLNRPLGNTQVIEVITSPNAHPHISWLRSVKSARARSKVRSWLNKHDDVIIDQNIVAKRKSFQEKPEGEPHDKKKNLPEGYEEGRILDQSKVGIKIDGESNLMIKLANCCNPTMGDDIVGYVSRGRGIIVHKTACKNLASINEIEDRQIEVEWETISPLATRRFKFVANKTSDLFSEIEGAVRKHRGHLIEGKIEEDHKGHLTGQFTMELQRKEDTQKVLKSLRTLPSMLTIQRI